MGQRPYHEELFKLKEQGHLFSFDQITREQLRKLWHEEIGIDSIIADLFDVKKSQVTYKRKKWNLTNKVCVREDLVKYLGLGQSCNYHSLSNE